MNENQDTFLAVFSSKNTKVFLKDRKWHQMLRFYRKIYLKECPARTTTSSYADKETEVHRGQ